MDEIKILFEFYRNMGQNKISLLLVAAGNSELLDFALGKNQYFLKDSEYGEHWVLGSWQQEIIPYGDQVSLAVNSMFALLTHEAPKLDEVERNDMLIYHAHVYFYLKKEGKTKILLESEVLKMIVQSLQSYLDHLKAYDHKHYQITKNSISIINRNGGLTEITL